VSGPRIPGYDYVSHLGTGGFAEVFLYEQEWPRQRVAVKVVRRDIPLTDHEKTLFTSEANAMARLADHPYIVSVTTAGVTDDGRPYLVMRYCPPPDLGVRVRAAPMSVADAVSTGIKLASAIETAHRSGILHRDIKPSNVLVTTYSEPALADFGIAGHVHELAGEAELRISYPWSPPELVDGRSNGSVASDVYSLGATIWNLLVGRSPYAVPNGDNSAPALSARILHSAPPATQRPDVPPALDRLLQQCLAKQPAHRPRSALELARGLQAIEAQAGFGRTPIAVAGDATVPTPAITHPGGDPDATHVKPMAVIASGPSRAEPAPPATAGTSSRSAKVWAVLGLAALVSVGVVLFLTAGGERSHDPQTSPTDTPSTPLDVVPTPVAPPVAPEITGSRSGAEIAFRWRTGTRELDGDTWEWRRTDTGAGQRTAGTAVTVRAPARVCLQVRMIRGTDASAWTEKCVD
jgi:eukaryotic-like serine/threonine-protein kinase